MSKINIFVTDIAQLPRAEQLAVRLGFPLVQHPDETADYQLLVSDTGLALQAMQQRATPFYIDFLSSQLTWRRQHASLRREQLARAMGLKSTVPPRIVDATAGLGRDSFILAALGFDIILLERSPLVATLLEDAFQRAQFDRKVGAIVDRMQLIETDAVNWMQQRTPENRPDIIYLDPMYPERNNTALAKKEMRIFQEIVGPDNDSAQLLHTALACAAKRVVVKRPRLAENLADISPSFSQEGSSSRFDIYLL